MKVKRITLTVEPDDSLWGFSDFLENLGEVSEEERIEAVIELVNEDFAAMFVDEDPCWTIEFTDPTGHDHG